VLEKTVTEGPTVEALASAVVSCPSNRSRLTKTMLERHRIVIRERRVLGVGMCSSVEKYKDDDSLYRFIESHVKIIDQTIGLLTLSLRCFSRLGD